MDKRIIISVINDLITDQRVNKVARTLTEEGYDVLLVGRKLKSSLPVNHRIYKTKRFRLIFNRSALFYAFYNIRLFFYFLFVKADIFLANDVDVLPANFFAARIRKKPLVFDSHELFSEVPELTNRKKVKAVWQKIEDYFIPKLENCYTVCQSIADFYQKKYNVKFEVVRNIPFAKQEISTPKTPVALPDGKIILYQGTVNIGRGLELIIEAMQDVEANLVVIGGGDVKEKLEQQAKKVNSRNNIIFLGRVPFEQLGYYTKMADVGISIEENLGLNYYYALPNKLFDYINAKIPVLVSDFPEMRRIIEDYGIGKILKERTPKYLAAVLIEMIGDEEQIKGWKMNLEKAKQELTWENEKEKLISVFNKL